MNEARASTGRPVGQLESLEHGTTALLAKVGDAVDNAESLHQRILGTRPPRNGGATGDKPEPLAHVEVMRDRLVSIDSLVDHLDGVLRSLMSAAGAEPSNIAKFPERETATTR